MRLPRSVSCLLLFVPCAGLAASFPCERSTTKVEHLICATPELGELDERMAALHGALAIACASRATTRARLSFAFKLAQTNAHLCSMQGRLRPIGDALEIVTTPDGFPDADCRLRIEFSEKEIILRDDDGRCRQQACGARASIDGMRFRKVAAKDGACAGVVGK